MHVDMHRHLNWLIFTTSHRTRTEMAQRRATMTAEEKDMECLPLPAFYLSFSPSLSCGVLLQARRFKHHPVSPKNENQTRQR